VQALRTDPQTAQRGDRAMKEIDELRYRDLAYVALNVSDLRKSAWFYEEMVGLQRCGGDEDRILFQCNDRHHDLMLVQSDTPGLKRSGWLMESAPALACAAAHFRASGLDVQRVPGDEAAFLGISPDAFRINQPHTGAVMEFFSDMDASARKFEPTVAKILRLGHVVIGVPDLPAVERFCMEDLHFAVSDRVGNDITFFRCFPNPYHHTYALSKAAENKLHHINFMVTEVDDIGKAMNRFRRNNVPVTYGPGRHPTSDSVFFYFADPDGHWVEYSFGMEMIAERAGRAARQFPLALESIDLWGGRPNRDYPQVGHLDTVG
jgi:2,3-dihydroxy-p-cumate/2,3-dihydroxybenzoate 3,4-dioxygenase